MWILQYGILNFIFLFFCVSFAEKVKQKVKEVACEEEIVQIEKSSVHKWERKFYSEPILYATSASPICLHNGTGEVYIRKCDAVTGEWSPSSSCVICKEIFQMKHNFYCPEDLIEIPIGDEYICLRISEDTHSFNESICYGSDTLFVEKSMRKAEQMAILSYLTEKWKINRFWLPVRRAQYNKYLNPLIVRLPGSMWGDIYEIPEQKSINMQDAFDNKNCLAVQIFSDSELYFKLEFTDCSEALPMVCIFKNIFVAYSGCPQGFGALAHRPNECFGIEWEAGMFPYELQAISASEYFLRRNELQMIFDSINLESNRYFVIGNFTDPDRNKFYIEMNRKEEFRVTFFNGQGRTLSFERLTCLNRKSVEMVLSFNKQLENLILTIYNRNYIWRFSDEENFGVKCFTNAFSDAIQWSSIELKMLWQNTLETKAIFKLKQSNRNGYYWCEAHTIFGFSLVYTNRIAVNEQKKEHVYAILMDFPYNNINILNLFSTKTWKYINKKINSMFKDREIKENKVGLKDLAISNARLMELVEFRRNKTVLRSLIHVSAYLRTSSIYQILKQSNEKTDIEMTSLDTMIKDHLKVIQLLTTLMPADRSKSFEMARSTMFCFPEKFYTVNSTQNYWQLSRYGQISTSLKLCVEKFGVPVKRMCLGDSLWGAFWEKLNYTSKLQCSLPNPTQVITYDLEKIVDTDLPTRSPEKVIMDVTNLLEHNLKKMIPADFYYISRIMQKLMNNILINKDLTLEKSEIISLEIARLYNDLFQVNENIAQYSAELNSTNVLLEAFEQLIDEITLKTLNQSLLRNNSDPTKLINGKKQIANKLDDCIKTIQYEDIGVVAKIAKYFAIFSFNPNISNITGVAIYRGKEDFIKEGSNIEGALNGAFQNQFYRFLLANQTVDDLMYEPDIELATYIPESLWHRFDEVSISANLTTADFSSIRFVIKIYANDILFQELSTHNDVNNRKKVSGKIISISVPEHDRDLPEMLPIIFRIPSNLFDNTDNFVTSCSYWNYSSWANDGLIYLGQSEIDNHVILCGCTHLTPFAYLIGGQYNTLASAKVAFSNETHQKLLDIITILGCSLSLLGTSGIFITALIFETWRQKASSKVLLHLCTAISLQMVLFCFVNTTETAKNILDSYNFASCIAIGALLHYSVLVQFSWMIIIGYLQFKRYVQVFGSARPTQFFRKSSLAGWGAPAIPVFIIVIFDRNAYIPENGLDKNQSICYPTGNSFYFGVIFPITSIIIANFAIFLLIIYNILRGPERVLRHTEKNLLLAQLRLSALLFFLLGFTWIFGLLATIRAGIVFSYLFCLTATLQGFVIFLYFIILDPKTRRMWHGFLANICGITENYESSSSMKETTQTLR